MSPNQVQIAHRNGEATLAAAYRQAVQTCLVVHHPAPGVLRMDGDDRLDFLNRMSTQELHQLAPSETAKTVFTTAIGRIVAVARVLSRENHVLLTTASGRSGPLRDWLQRYIFFQDQVGIEPLPGPWIHLGMYGPQAPESAQAIAPGLPELDPGRTIELPDGAAWGVQRPQPGLEFVLSGNSTQRAEQLWPAEPFQMPAYEALRIETGLPAVGREITEEAIPLEVGLWDAVSFSKGCYIGQEIIARMESRGRLTRRLLGVRLDGPAEPGAPLRQADSRQGTLTSVAESPWLGWIGLAMVRPAALDRDDGWVRIGEDGVSGQLLELPFDQHRTPKAK